MSEAVSVTHAQHSLSKSDYLHGIQCEKRLYLERVAGVVGESPSEADLRRLRQGQEVTQAARARFTGGILIREEGQSIEDAVRKTQEAIEAGESVLFEAAFLHDGAYAYTDILERQDDGTWHLIEVKMNSQKKKPHKEHLQDVSFQAYVARGAGLPVSKVSLMLINSDFVHPDQGDLFALEDITDLLDDEKTVVAKLELLQDALASESTPDVHVSRHCWSPRDCPYMDLCWGQHKQPTIFGIHNSDLYWTHKEQLLQDGYFYLQDIPEDYELQPKSWQAIERVLDKRVDVDQHELRKLMKQLNPPLAFLDFEADSYPIPKYAGAKPYQKIPFQFSLHILGQDGDPDHEEYLHVEPGDPREALVNHLLDLIPATGSVVVYSNFEKQVLDQLREDFPEHNEALKRIQDRIWDQLDVFKGPYRHHAFADSNSIKKVLPELVPELSYDDIAVQDGTHAQVVWEKIQNRTPGWEDAAKNLREYCKLDTFAMVELHRHLESVMQGGNQ